jgi:citrate lyase beta subunit
MDYIQLGASLYLPANRDDISEVVLKGKYPFLTSVILDTEDSVSIDTLDKCYDNLKNLLVQMPVEKRANQLLVFLRPRNLEEFKKVIDFKYIERFDGFVLPKFSAQNMHSFIEVLPEDMWYMPVLENDIFTEQDLLHIRDFILEHRKNLLSVRIGMTDILKNLKTRRNTNCTIYDINVASHMISRVILMFAPHDINVTGAVFEHFGVDSVSILRKEVEKDLQNGIFGKSSIHPAQVKVINEMYKVSEMEFEMASKLLQNDSPAVFKFENTMQECATHSEWAKKIIARKEIYGLF